jgi:hypothetical protein
MRIPAKVRFCHSRIVSVSGITPVVGSRAAGMAEGVACMSAADEESPRAQTLPRPR